MFQRPTDISAIAQALVPQSATSGAKNGAAIDTLDYEGVCFVLEVGAITGTGKVNMKIQRAIDAAFSSPIDVVGAALVEITDAGGSLCYIIDVRDPIMRYLRAVVTPSTAASVFGVTAIPYGKHGLRPPAAAATQVVSVSGV